ncbi:hypothetical protein BDF14DRAFT_1782639 [Spinellus fusiger]|nr:hypothetical protein BDF14DRAFT_1782639 [Spinellus fusiger]
MKQYVEVGPEQPNGGRIRRSIHSVDRLCRSPHKDIHTLYDILQYSARRYQDTNAFGYRKVEKIVEEEKQVTRFVGGVETKEEKTWKYFQLSGYHYISYKEAACRALDIGSGLTHLGLKVQSKLGMFASTSLNWMIMAHGAFTQNMTIVTAYETLGEDGLMHSMNETGVEVLYTSFDLLDIVIKVASRCSTLKYIIYSGDVSPQIIKDVHTGNIQKVLSVEDLVQLGREHPKEPNAPEPEDSCCIMYTSGSTGNPKGVLISHKNIISAIAASNHILKSVVADGDTVLAYLPLAHILEFLIENLSIYMGITLGYGSVRTLTDVSVRNCKGDIREFRPSLMVGVPAVWETIRKTILAKVEESSPNIQAVFKRAVIMKEWLKERHLPTYLLDRIVFNKVKEQLGGRLRLALSGSAPLSYETQSFLEAVLCPVTLGFGLTEACGVSSVAIPSVDGLGNVGGPSICCEIKLVDVPDAGYFSTNTPRPQGEVWIRGPTVTKGYWKREDITKEMITEDGWLMTGDIGEWNDNNTLNIIDRKKNLVKMSNGEYIAIEKLESIYKSCVYIQNMCICADSLMPRPVALVIPIEASLRKFAKQKGVEEEQWDKICKNSVVKNALLGELLLKAKASGFKSSELLHDIYIVNEEWTIESGHLTNSQKLKRIEISRAYKDQIAAANATQTA